MIPCNDSKRLFAKYQKEFEEAAIKCLRSGWYILGKEVSSFENAFAEKIGSKYCVGVDNGLDAIYLGIKALGIGPEDEILIQSNTYIATFLGATLNGATPVFIEPNEYLNIDSSLIESKITSHTKAILVTHLYGQATNMAKICEICKKHNIYLLEDCAQAHFAKYDGKQVGTFGDFGFFSFYPTKNLGGFGDGGAVVTNNKNLADKIIMLRNYGSKVRYEFEEEGLNARLDELQAALLNVKLKYADEITAERLAIANKYLNNINNPLIKLPKTDFKCTSVWHLFVLQVENREAFRKHMEKCGVCTDVHYPIPPHLSKCYKKYGYKVGDFPICEKLANTVVDIPLFNGMSEEEIEQVIEAVNTYGK